MGKIVILFWNGYRRLRSEDFSFLHSLELAAIWNYRGVLKVT